MMPLLFTLLAALGLFFGFRIWKNSKAQSSKKPSSKSKKKSPSPLDSSQSIQSVPSSQLSPLMEKLLSVLGDRYEKIEAMAVGGMGLIATGWDKNEKRPVAIKTILPELEANQRAIRLFFDEGKAIQKINHPNIVRFYDVGEKEILYYVMEYLEGETLKSLIKKKGCLPVGTAVKIGTQVARALQHCHDNNIIHRDIKPSNIFLTEKGTVKIIDFGIVKLITDQAALQQGTTKVGSPDYAAPEQMQGQAISGKSDIYALGVCLFLMLAGELPFKSGNFLTRALEEPKSLKEFCPDAPEALIELVHRCLHPDPKERVTSMELWAGLRKITI